MTQRLVRAIAVFVVVVGSSASEARLKAGSSVDHGSLVIESEPAGASVFIDGRLAGDTPLTLTTVAAGVHRVRVVRLGYLENSRLVTVKPGAQSTLKARLTDPTPQMPQGPALKIVVVEGEGAVNIIQQKTAVAPVIEVRDRNDQPVSGAVVKFAITKGKASFDGVRTLSVTTNAVGRATAAGLTPTGSGALQIAASATFQGQAAAISIAQTTVATAAEASSIAAGGGAASAGGGGLSHTALAGILGGAGAAVAGVAVASKGGGQPGTTQAQTPPGPPSVYTLLSVNGVAVPVQILPECQLGGALPPCAPCIVIAAAGTLTLNTAPATFVITLRTDQTCVDPLGVSPTSSNNLTNTDTGSWSAQPDGTITFSGGKVLNLTSGRQSGSALSVSFDWLSQNGTGGTPNVPVTTQWSK